MILEAKCVLTMSYLNRFGWYKNYIFNLKTIYHNIFANRGQFVLMGFIFKYTDSLKKCCLGLIV